MAETGKSERYDHLEKIYKCKLCKTMFNDIFDYAEHLESKEHVKAIMKNKYGEKFLVAKAKLDGKAPENPESNHDDVQKEHSDDSSDEDAEVFTCEVCRKICTGLLSYKLHLEGKKHYKMVAKVKLMKDMNLLSDAASEKTVDGESLLDRVMTKNYKFASDDIECKVCGIKCTGPTVFKQHCKGAAHKKKKEAEELMKTIKSEGQSPTLIKKDDEAEKEFPYCNICEKTFSGPFPYIQHMDSFQHLKQERNLKQLNKIKDLVVSSEEDTSITCKECGTVCTGPVPFNEHLKSSAHGKMKKKTAMLEDLERQHPELVKIPGVENSASADSDSDDNEILGCGICNVSFSGPESACNHFSSKRHKKAFKKKSQIQKYKQQQKQKKQSGSSIEAKATTETVADTKASNKIMQKKTSGPIVPESHESVNSEDEFDIIQEQ